MGTVTFETIFILILILANGFLAMAEIAIISARKARLQRRAERGDDKARAALELAQDPADFLSTVQIGITLVGVMAGAFGGATIAAQIADWLSTVPQLEPYSQAIAIGVVVIAITYLTLVLGELAPKRIALTNAENIASAVAGPMRRLAWIASPLVRFLSRSTDLVLRIIGVKPNLEPPVTEEEIKVLIEQGTEAGVFLEVEQDMVEAVFRLGDRTVGTIMTPRTEIAWLDLDDPVEENMKMILGSVHARFPVARGDLDHTEGVVQAKDLLAQVLAGEVLNIEEAISQPLIVPESMQALRVLELFKQSSVHTALVIGEFGGFQGIVTVFDILESIVGDIPIPGERIQPEVVQREDGSWLIDGLLPVDEFKEIFDIDRLPEEEKGRYQTMGGFVMTMLGHVPSAADYFEWGGQRFEVVDMDGFRVDKIIVIPLDEEATRDKESS
jgi:putative hemolysin